MKSKVIGILKDHPFISLFILSVTLLEMVPAGTYTLLNAATYAPATGFRLVTPRVIHIFEPFLGIPIYLSTTHSIKAESISLFVWGVVFVSLYSVAKKRIRKIPAYLSAYLLCFSLFVFSILFARLPLLKAVPRDSAYCLIDPHSHTYYSHDGLATPSQNILYHVDQGFTGWYVTDHYNIRGAINEQDLAMASGRRSMIGEEVRVSDDPHFFLALGITSPVSPMDITSVSALTGAVHRQGGAVVLALWWLHGKTDLGHYIEDGVDAFEIANSGHKQRLDASVRRAAYGVSQRYHIPLLASSDWHGWGNYAYTWTAFDIPGASTYSAPRLNDAVVSMLRDRRSGGIIPIVYDYPHQYWGTLRFVFGPFFDFYYYFSTLPFQGYVSWIAWSLVLWSLSTAYGFIHRQFFSNRPMLLGHMFLIGASLAALYHAIGAIRGLAFVPVENTLLLTVMYVVLFYSSGMLFISVLWLYIGHGRKRRVK
ncbi:MAG: hypothetical protein M1517_10215 [Deltaproteobacteria bacterium]|nr:hypothetical protein [Deltaproteobacteria bacterium]